VNTRHQLIRVRTALAIGGLAAALAAGGFAIPVAGSPIIFGAGGITVNSEGDADDGDTTDGVCDTGNATKGFTGVCTLRAAIETANANSVGTTITFTPGVHHIAIGNVLPRCLVPVTIDGSTNGGMVELDGTNAFGGDTIFDPIGIALYAGSSTLRGMDIYGFGTAIDLGHPVSFPNGGNVIEGNFIGTNVTGTSIPAGRKQAGILVFTGNNRIGGTTAAARNIISGNLYGIDLSGPGSTQNTVQGNYIGTDVSGTVALGNSQFGVGALDAPNNLIGGAVSGARNIVSATTNGSGVVVNTSNAPADNNTVQGNYIGTDMSGTVALGNSQFGVVIGSKNNLVGGTTPAARNVISGNVADGVNISSTGNTLQGNYIGVDVNGTQPLGNGGNGVTWGQQTATIGGAIPAAGNVISANSGNGVSFSAPNSLIQNNLIGVDATGTQPLGNHGSGVVAGLGTDGSTILNNVLSASGGHGLFIAGAFGGPQHIVVQGNIIGSDINITKKLGNGGDGIHVNDAALETIGGSAAGQGNVIAGSGQNGVFIIGSNQSQTHIVGNFIGTDPTGTLNLGNANYGTLTGGFEFVGGFNPGEGNVIAFNQKGVVYTNNDLIVSSNAIYNNTLIGIDWNDDGVTPNGPANLNRNINFPTLTSVSVSNGSTTIQGNYNPGFVSNFRLEFFASPTGDPSGFGQGQRYLGATTIAVSVSANFSVTLPTVVFGGQFITATAMYAASTRSSEFSPWLQLAVGNAVDVTSLVQVKRSGFRYNRSTGHFVQNVTLTNTANFTLAGPVSLVLDNLSGNAGLFNKTGVTQQMTPAGSPYIDLAPGGLAPGASASVSLEFTDPARTAITYNTRVLAGPGSR
jgi:CSLREA domain-containing protein